MSSSRKQGVSRAHAIKRSSGSQTLSLHHSVSRRAAMATAAGVETAAVHAEARVGELSRSALDPGRAGRELGWAPTTSLADGTVAVLDWFRTRG
jgi:nucleoside-diphosphate-sugar epimerase